MTKQRFALAVAVIGALALCMSAQSGASAKPAKLSAPVIHENFTLLPCSGKKADRTTLQLEGCAEHTVLHWDSQIDTLNAEIFKKLANASAQKQFISGHNAWLTYRHRYCLSTAVPFSGGTISAVVYIDCVAAVNGAHVQQLDNFVKSLKPS